MTQKLGQLQASTLYKNDKLQFQLVLCYGWTDTSAIPVRIL
jgi:hypothetical protein